MYRNCKGKSPEVLFQGITLLYSYFEAISIFAPIQQEAEHDQEKRIKGLLTKASIVLPYSRSSQDSSNQAKVQICCTVKLIP